jgi:hypothetical protein
MAWGVNILVAFNEGSPGFLRFEQHSIEVIFNCRASPLVPSAFLGFLIKMSKPMLFSKKILQLKSE